MYDSEPEPQHLDLPPPEAFAMLPASPFTPFQVTGTTVEQMYAWAFTQARIVVETSRRQQKIRQSASPNRN